MTQQRIAFITGITGQDGSYLTQLLLDKQYIVYGLIRRSSNLNTQRIEHIIQAAGSNLRLRYGDVTDGCCIVNILNEIATSHPTLSRLEIYNLAAMSHVKISFEMPEYTAQVDGLGTLKILEAIRTSAIKDKIRFYQASTSELYGKVLDIPQTEKTPFNPVSPYAAAKIYAYYITKLYRESYNLFACTGVLFNHETVFANMSLLFTHDKSSIDIKPICEVVNYHITDFGTIVDESRHEYQSGFCDKDTFVWDQTGWTKVRFASGYKHEPTTNPKHPAIVVSPTTCCGATDSHQFIMNDNSEKALRQIKVGDKVKTSAYPRISSTTTHDHLNEWQVQFIAYVLALGNVDATTNGIHIYLQNEQDNVQELISHVWNKIRCDACTIADEVVTLKEKEQEQVHLMFPSLSFLAYKDCYNCDNTLRIPKAILNASKELRALFLQTWMSASSTKLDRTNSIRTDSPTFVHGMTFLLDTTSEYSYRIEVNRDVEKEQDSNIVYQLTLSCKKEPIEEDNHVHSVINIPSYDGWFYDLETESGTFMCGPGRGVVHNSPVRGFNFVTRKITLGLGKILNDDKYVLTLGNIDSLRDWGHAQDYVEGMWLMLQQDQPDDFVLATGKQYSVREFVESSFKLKGFDVKWRGEGVNEIGYDANTGRELVHIDAKYYRPNEVDNLLGCAAKAEAILGWKPSISFETLVQQMVEHDCNNAHPPIV